MGRVEYRPPGKARLTAQHVVEIADVDDPRFRDDDDEEHAAAYHMIGTDLTGQMRVICVLEIEDGLWRAITGWKADIDDADWYRRNR